MTITELKRMNNPHQPVGRWITVKRRLAVYLRDGFMCLLCERDLSTSDAFEVTLDHHVPRARGGGNDSDNVYTCCRQCNHDGAHGRRRGPELRRVRRQLALDMSLFLDAAAVMLVSREIS